MTAANAGRTTRLAKAIAPSWDSPGRLRGARAEDDEHGDEGAERDARGARLKLSTEAAPTTRGRVP